MAFGTDLLNTRAFLAPHIEPGMRVADFGVGRTGHVLVHASDLVGDTGEVFAVDIVPDVLDMVCRDCARRGLTNITRSWGDFERNGGVPIADSSLDLVTCVNNLWSTGKPAQMFAEAQRVLKPDGKLLIVDWHKRAQHPVGPPIASRVHPSSATRWLSGLQVQDVQEIRISPHHWGLLCSFA